METCLYVRKIFTSKCILSFTLFHLIRGVANNKEGLKNFIFLVNLWRGGTNKLNWMDKNWKIGNWTSPTIRDRKVCNNVKPDNTYQLASCHEYTWIWRHWYFMQFLTDANVSDIQNDKREDKKMKAYVRLRGEELTKSLRKRKFCKHSMCTSMFSKCLHLLLKRIFRWALNNVILAPDLHLGSNIKILLLCFIWNEVYNF